ncbi:uncharacterized protein DUF1896 [Dysgonomonas alginatilytica]|uniref:Uncharacterized protein DUF1896 n=1 Tax=Dysgonomonas alginatilytica TaxID=1605892 RepID=A0A2V3PH46_9BACT|nr:DUF1896 family protein [Dysgonomonas alginatilytica]PXV56877.1 uncharacterized protein DUF1896 [Dysgonomonas alginatilytica]
MKTTKNTSNTQQLSYYELSLLSFLKESHPQLGSDTNFIKTRAEEAAETYSNAIKNGMLPNQAEELANEVLFLGLHFSRHDTLVNILWNEFADTVPQSEAKELASRIQSECEEIFANYNLTDEYLGSEEYNLLYTELTGCIDIWLEENEL